MKLETCPRPKWESVGAVGQRAGRSPGPRGSQQEALRQRATICHHHMCRRLLSFSLSLSLPPSFLNRSPQTGEALSAAGRRYKGATDTLERHKCSFNGPEPSRRGRAAPLLKKKRVAVSEADNFLSSSPLGLGFRNIFPRKKQKNIFFKFQHSIVAI